MHGEEVDAVDGRGVGVEVQAGGAVEGLGRLWGIDLHRLGAVIVIVVGTGWADCLLGVGAAVVVAVGFGAGGFVCGEGDAELGGGLSDVGLESGEGGDDGVEIVRVGLE